MSRSRLTPRSLAAGAALLLITPAAASALDFSVAYQATYTETDSFVGIGPNAGDSLQTTQTESLYQATVIAVDSDGHVVERAGRLSVRGTVPETSPGPGRSESCAIVADAADTADGLASLTAITPSDYVAGAIRDISGGVSADAVPGRALSS